MNENHIQPPKKISIKRATKKIIKMPVFSAMQKKKKVVKVEIIIIDKTDPQYR